MLEIFIILNEKDAEKGQGKGAEGRGGSDTRFFFVFFGFFFLVFVFFLNFWERKKYLGLPSKKHLF